MRYPRDWGAEYSCAKLLSGQRSKMAKRRGFRPYYTVWCREFYVIYHTSFSRNGDGFPESCGYYWPFLQFGFTALLNPFKKMATDSKWPSGSSGKTRLSHRFSHRISLSYWILFPWDGKGLSNCGNVFVWSAAWSKASLREFCFSVLLCASSSLTLTPFAFVLLLPLLLSFFFVIRSSSCRFCFCFRVAFAVGAKRSWMAFKLPLETGKRARSIAITSGLSYCSRPALVK